MNIFEEVLAQSKKDKQIIGIREYGEDTKFSCGYVVDYTFDWVLIQHFSILGLADGLILMQTQNMESLEVNSDYTCSFQKLSTALENNINSIWGVKLPQSENWASEFIAPYLNAKKVIEIIFEDGFGIHGRVAKLDHEFIKFETVGDLGELDGACIYRLENIMTIHIDSLESRKRGSLLELK